MSVDNILSRVDNTDWQALGYPKMAQWIRILVFDYVDIDTDIFWDIDEFTIGKISETSVLFTNFLVEFIQSDEIINKEELLKHLFYVISGLNNYVNADRQSLALEITQIVIKNKYDYLKFVQNQQNGWHYVLYMMVALAEYMYDLIPELIHILEQTSDLDIKKECFRTLRFLIEAITEDNLKQKYISYLLHSFETEKNLSIQQEIAFVLLHLQKRDISLAVVQTIKQFFYSNNIYNYIDKIFILDVDTAIKIITESFESRIRDRYDIFYRIASLLSLSFEKCGIHPYEVIPFGFVVAAMNNFENLKMPIWHFRLRNKNHPITPVTTLDERQKRVLLSITQHKELWDIETNLYTLYGLPETLAEIEKLVNDTP